MTTASPVDIYITIAAFLISVFGSLLTIILISNSYLKELWKSVDRIIQDKKYQEYINLLSTPRQASFLYKFSKRMFDLILALVLLIELTPLFLLISIILKLDSPGPVFISQMLIGLNKKRFRAIKFRTMTLEVEEERLDIKTAFRSWNDRRITRVGRFLRQTSLDELPKLLNIFKGDMSFVGTSIATDFAYIEEIDPRAREILAQSKPGLVSLWSLSGRSWKLDLETRILFDLHYVLYQSLLLDFGILIRTIPSMLGRAGTR